MAATTQTTPSTIIVKIIHENKDGTDIRRFTSTTDLSWTDLNTRVLEFFEFEPKTFRLTYVDDEQDVVTMSSDEELKEAIALAVAAGSTLRLNIKKLKAPKMATTTDAGTGTATAPRGTSCARRPDHVPPDVAQFVETLAKQLPAAMGALPAALRKILPDAELDVAATIAANQAAAAGEQADRFCPLNPHGPNAKPGVHVGVSCDKTGMSPIVGNRYHLVGHNYDVCEAEFLKLDDKEKANFRKIAPPPAVPDAKKPADEADAKPYNCDEAAYESPPNNPPSATPRGFHPGVECDKSGMCPIAGMRYNLRGHNYDLCQAEYDKLPPEEQALYDAIPPPFVAPPGLPKFAQHMMGKVANGINGVANGAAAAAARA